MKERPILFSGEMVRAILEGRKTQTRRPVNPQPDDSGLWDDDKRPRSVVSDLTGWNGTVDETGDCPYGNPGERLWVRETWRWFDSMIETDQEGVYSGYMYRADINPAHDDGLKWRPSIHMPRSACRLLLEVVDVRVERLNDISEKDAIAEGVERDGVGWKHYVDPDDFIVGTARQSFFTLMQSIYGPGVVERNPWCWAIQFRRVQQQSEPDYDNAAKDYADDLLHQDQPTPYDP